MGATTSVPAEQAPLAALSLLEVRRAVAVHKKRL